MPRISFFFSVAVVLGPLLLIASSKLFLSLPHACHLGGKQGSLAQASSGPARVACSDDAVRRSVPLWWVQLSPLHVACPDLSRHSQEKLSPPASLAMNYWLIGARAHPTLLPVASSCWNQFLVHLFLTGGSDEHQILLYRRRCGDVFLEFLEDW
jgi:hypothetical protein